MQQGRARAPRDLPLSASFNLSDLSTRQVRSFNASPRNKNGRTSTIDRKKFSTLSQLEKDVALARDSGVTMAVSTHCNATSYRRAQIR